MRRTCFINQSTAKVTYVLQDSILHGDNRLWSQSPNIDASSERMLLFVGSRHRHFHVPEEVIGGAIDLRLLHIRLEAVYIAA